MVHLQRVNRKFQHDCKKNILYQNLRIGFNLNVHAHCIQVVIDAKIMYLKSSANLLQNVNDNDNNLEYENKSDVFTMSCLLSKAHNIFYSYKIMIMSE